MWALGDQAVADLQLFKKKKTQDDDPTEWLYMIMHPVANGECVIDRRIAFELLHQLGVHESRRELRTSLWIDASTVTRVFECGTKYRDGKSSDGFTAGSPLHLVRTLLRTSSRPISTAAHRRDRHYRDASGREHRRASEL